MLRSDMEPPNPSPPASPEIEHLRQAVAELQQRVAALELGASPLPPAQHHESAESRFGLTVVNGAGAITLAIGIVFFFKYAVDNQWIGAAGRVLFGLIGGLLLIVGAEWLRRRDQQTFSQGIAGCGLAILYISLYAAFAFYHLFPQALAFIALIVTSSLAIALCLRYASAPIAALGLAGALLTPVLLHNDTSTAGLNFAYLLLLDAAAIVISVRQRWPVLIPATGAWTIISAAYLLPEAIWFVIFGTSIALLHFAAALRVPARFRGYRKTSSQLYITAHGTLLVALLRLVSFWGTESIAHDERTSFVSIVGSILIGLYGITLLAVGIAQRSTPNPSTLNRSIGLTLLGIVVAKLYLYDVWLLTRFYRISSFVVLGVLLLTASYVYSRFRSRSSVS